MNTKLLVVAATPMEIGPFRAYMAAQAPAGVELLITGVGATAATYALTARLASGGPCPLALQAGVGGAFASSLRLGELVFVTSEQFGDAGAEDHEQFIDVFDMGLLDRNTAPFTGGQLINPLIPAQAGIYLPAATGLTVSTVSGSERTITLRRQKYGKLVESMEGAAFHYVCLRQGVPFAQVRAVSNYVIPRDKSQWQMKDAIINLNNWLIDYVEGMVAKTK